MRALLPSSLLLVTLVVLVPDKPLSVRAQSTTDPEVEAILADMSPEQRVGQLFLVTFYGSDASLESDIGQLISSYKIGGVVLVAGNDNFPAESDQVMQVYELTSALQSVAAATRPAVGDDGVISEPRELPYVPLFIGVQHEASAMEFSPLTGIVSPLPSNLAIGATWKPENAQASGAILGRELNSLGINLLLGTPADVLEEPHPFSTGDMGLRVYGGEPFWVSQMTAAYVRGIHQGSNDRVAVVPGHFPGLDSADRSAAVEIPTVRRSKDQLQQFDLVPFYAVTGGDSDAGSVADGLLVGHIKYQGFQGENRLLTTRPISLDPQALQEVLQLVPIRDWHDAGGIVISDALGMRGVRRFYDSRETRFPHRQVAQDAFYAGNDVLYLGSFGSNPPVDQQQSTIDTINYFVQTYYDDPDFKARVDESAARIIRQKLDLYGTFDPEVTVGPRPDSGLIGSESNVALATAQQSLTLLSPEQPELLQAPQPGDHIVILTDTRTYQRCSVCQPQPFIPVDSLQSTILRLYGPEGSGIVNLADISSHSFDRLDSYLEFGVPTVAGTDATPAPDPLAVDLERADWVVFVMLDVNPNLPSSYAVKRFLSESPVSPNTEIVVMAMAAPYYLDATEIGKLSAYYGLYGYSRPFMDVAARALFQQAAITGASPVSVDGIGYKILDVTTPDPSQTILLLYSVELPALDEDDDDGGTPTGEPTLTPSPTGSADAGPTIRIGDTLRISTSPILDYNGHAVPDGTPVEFTFNYIGGNVTTLTATTTDGVARVSYPLVQSGDLVITASSGLAQNSAPITARISEEGTVEFITQTPSPPTLTPSPTLVLSPQTPAPVSPTPTPTATPPSDPSVDFGDLFLSVLGLVMIAGLVFGIATVRNQGMNQSLMLALISFAAGLIGYTYFALVLPGVGWWIAVVPRSMGAALIAWLGALVAPVLTLGLLHSWETWIFRWLRER